MKKRAWIALAVLLPALAAAALYGYWKWGAQTSSARNNVLDGMPADATAVLFIDLAELRTAPFIAQLYAWAPKPQADPDYAQFVKDTGFDYERDLDRVAIAFEKSGQDSIFFALAEGKFDQSRISAYSLKTSTVSKKSGREIFTVPVSGGERKISFSFLRNDRIALTNGPDLTAVLTAKSQGQGNSDWRTRFDRLAGSPIFAVIRQDAAAGAALAAQAPGNFRSPQLSVLLDQLQWITIAGKPENDRLRIVAEGECSAEATMRQLADLLNGVLVLAEAGLNDAQTRRQLDPAARAAYLELLKSTDVSKIDRGDTKSVRLAFEITPAFLETARQVPPSVPGATPGKPLPNAGPQSKKGHT
jgi:hypothetical protein